LYSRLEAASISLTPKKQLMAAFVSGHGFSHADSGF